MATFTQATGQTIAEAFAAFDAANPQVYELFKKYVREVVKAKGKNVKTSSKLIINRIRWEVYVQTNSQDEFKINDAFTAHYARKFASDYPDYAHLFNYKHLRAAWQTSKL